MKVHALVAKKTFDLELLTGGVILVGGQKRQVELCRLESGVYSLLIDGASYEVVVRREMKGGRPVKGGYVVEVSGHILPVKFGEPGQKEALGQEGDEGPGSIESPMPGRIVGIKVSVGQEVKVGEGVILVEAMKMENELTAPKSGKIREIKVKVGEAVESGQELVVIE